MTELIWEGKYKDDKKVTPVRIALPFQTIETINESNDEREKQIGFRFDTPRDAEWRNRLIWGDKKYVLPSLIPEFAGKVNLIYIDPPFNVGSDFSFTAKIADDPDTDSNESSSFVKQPSIIEKKAYRDTWGKGLDSYMQWFFETALLLKELLADNGSIYVHLDWHVSHYAKTILDEVFGYEKFVNEIVWKRTNVHSHAAQGTKHFSRIQDSIFFYGKNEDRTWNQPYTAHSAEHIANSYKLIEDKTGRRYSLGDLTATDGGAKGNPIFEFLGVTRYWRYNKEKMEALYSQNRIVQTSPGAVPRQKRYLDESKGSEVGSLWSDINAVQAQATERVDYATQKPETLLERIIMASSNEGDIVLDCFCGSGTTAAVAEKLGRRWITCDLGRFAIHTARKRFLGINNVKPFVVQNLGKYERQQWMNAEFENPADRFEQEKTYKHFIIDLYHAKPLDGYTWLHGAKAGKMIHVGNVDAPVTVDDIKATIKEFWKLVGTEEAARSNGIDFLGWDFAFDVNETAAHFAAANKVNASFKKIPREVLEKKAVEQGDIRFYELASLDIETKSGKSELSVMLKDFIIPPDDVPEDVRGKITHWSQWIDYWAIDWNYRDDTFHNEWQSYRTKKESKIDLTARNKYKEAGKYTILVKVIDILGNDTTKAIEVEV